MQSDPGQENQEQQGDKLDELKHHSLEFLILYLIFNKQIKDIDILILFLKHIPEDVDALFSAIHGGNENEIRRILTNGAERTPLPTEKYYSQILGATIKEHDKLQAEHLLRYFLFFPLDENNHPDALGHLIKKYESASAEEKKHIISPYCWTAKTIFIDGTLPEQLHKKPTDISPFNITSKDASLHLRDFTGVESTPLKHTFRTDKPSLITEQPADRLSQRT